MPDHWSAQTELPQGPNHCPVSSGSMGDRLPGRLLRCYSLESPSTRSLSRGVPSPVISTATCRVRFHLLLPDPNPVPYASLDVDDRTSSGPETVTVSHDPSTGLFVAGDYRYWVHNFSIPPEFNVSSAVVAAFQCNVRLAQFSVNNATGNPALDVWRVFNFTLTSAGAITITPLQVFEAGSSGTVFQYAAGVEEPPPPPGNGHDRGMEFSAR